MKCPNCEAELSSEGICEECGWIGSPLSSEQLKWPELSAGCLIAGRFGITEALDTTPGHKVRVYLAEDQRDGQMVKVKEALSGTPAAEGLRREHDILRAFSHSAVPKALDLVDAERSVFLMLQHLVGVPLSEAWQVDDVTEAQRLDWLIQLCDALNELHSQDIVYLAVHPERLLITEDQRLVLADFSQARRLPISADDRLIGFEYYSAPEVFLAPKEVDIRADIYGLGATWYALLLGKPLGSEEFEEMFFAKPPIELLPDLLPATNRTIAKAMQRLPKHRHKSVLYLRDALEEIKEQLGREPSPTVGVYSDTGLVRDANEDHYLVEEFRIGDEDIAIRCGFYLISDGMGGEAGGVIASRLTTQAMAEVILPNLKSYHLREIGQDLSEQIQPLLENAINKACTAVYNRAQEDPLLLRMGATVVAAVLLGRQLYVANVGDSRAYLVNQDGITQLTRDHTVIAELIEQGDLDKEKARDHPAQGQLTRNIGAKPEVEAHFCHRELNPGDVVLLCSDGLTDVVEDDEIQRIVIETPTRQEACHQLINLANDRGSPDNITVILTGFNRGEEG
jgi:protein phosphatase